MGGNRDIDRTCEVAMEEVSETADTGKHACCSEFFSTSVFASCQVLPMMQPIADRLVRLRFLEADIGAALGLRSRLPNEFPVNRVFRHRGLLPELRDRSKAHPVHLFQSIARSRPLSLPSSLLSSLSTLNFTEISLNQDPCWIPSLCH